MSGSLEKRLLLDTWMKGTPHGVHTLMASGETIPDPSWARRLPERHPGGDFVYLLVVGTGTEARPAYIGRAASPAQRWMQHLSRFRAGQGSYGRWVSSLLDELGRARTELALVVVAARDVDMPPIPGFPVTPGAIEYQLISLASDAHPGQLLNHEGVGR